jgi:protein SCO1/2
MNRLILILATCLLLVACNRQPPGLPLQHAVVTTSPRPVAEFRLLDAAGQDFSRADLLGHWTILFSGFTHCPDVCPTTLGLLRAAEQLLVSGPRHRVVLVTVDPQRDTPEVLLEYLQWFNPAWIGLSGPEAELDRLLTSLQMAHVRVPDGDGGYTMDHASAVVLIDPQARMVAYWKPPLQAAQLAEDMAALPAPRTDAGRHLQARGR